MSSTGCPRSRRAVSETVSPCRSLSANAGASAPTGRPGAAAAAPVRAMSRLRFNVAISVRRLSA